MEGRRRSESESKSIVNSFHEVKEVTMRDREQKVVTLT